MSQFPPVNAIYGAPMGRREFAWRFAPSFIPRRFLRVYRVRINSGGYDDGGAYWGIGQPLYCVGSIADECDYRKFVRANDRISAIEKLHIPDSWLVRRA